MGRERETGDPKMISIFEADSGARKGGVRLILSLAARRICEEP